MADQPKPKKQIAPAIRIYAGDEGYVDEVLFSKQQLFSEEGFKELVTELRQKLWNHKDKLREKWA